MGPWRFGGAQEESDHGREAAEEDLGWKSEFSTADWEIGNSLNIY